jgi:hypothetical protein
MAAASIYFMRVILDVFSEMKSLRRKRRLWTLFNLRRRYDVDGTYMN